MLLNEEQKKKAMEQLKEIDAKFRASYPDSGNITDMVSLTNKLRAIKVERYSKIKQRNKIKETILGKQKEFEQMMEGVRSSQSIDLMEKALAFGEKFDREIEEEGEKIIGLQKEIAGLEKQWNEYKSNFEYVREREKLLAKLEDRVYTEPLHDSFLTNLNYSPEEESAYEKEQEKEKEKEIAFQAPLSTDLVANMRKRPDFQEWCQWFCKENGYTIKNFHDTSKLEFIPTSGDHSPITIYKNSVSSPCPSNGKFDKEKLFADMIALYQQGFNEPITNHRATGMPKKPELLLLLEIRLAETLVSLSRLADTINGKSLDDILSKRDSIIPTKGAACVTLSSKQEPVKTPSTVMAFQAVYHHDRGRSTLTPVDLFTEFRGRENFKKWCEQFCKKHEYTIANIDDPTKLEFSSTNPDQRSIIIQANTISAAQSPASPDEYPAFAEAYTELYLQALGDNKKLKHKITDCPSADLLDCLERTLAAKLIEHGHQNDESINGKSLLLFTSESHALSKQRESKCVDETPETTQSNSTTTIIRR